MQESNNSSNHNHHNDEIDLWDVFYALLNGKWIIISLTTFISILGVIYSLLLPNIYESKALLVPVNPSSSIAGALKSYGGLVGLGSIGVPLSRDDEGNSLKAIKKISSLSFFENNILPNIYLPDLMAIKSWDPMTNKVVFNQKIFDTNRATWVRKYSYPQQQIPSAQESFEVFTQKHLILSESKKSGFTTLLIKHQSPFIAKQWAELVVNEVNNFYRQKDKLESERSVSYLNQQISMTGLTEIKQVLAQLLQEETKKLALIEANQYYVFDYIDPPAVMEAKSEPKRSIICIFIALMGGIASVLLVLIRHYFFSQKDA